MKPPPIVNEISGTTYFLPTTRIEYPARAYIPAPPQSAQTTGTSGVELVEELLYQQSLTSLYVDPKPKQYPDIGRYYSLFPIEPDSQIIQEPSGRIFSFPSVVYRGYNNQDGCVYALRRFRGCNKTAVDTNVLDRWKAVSHPNVTSVRDAFVTKLFGDNSYVIVYDFMPGAQTIRQCHFQKDQFQNPHIFHNKQFPKSLDPKSELISESLLWNYIIQLTAGLRSIHLSGLACRAVDPSKITISGRSRIRLNCCGVMDLLSMDDESQKPYVVHQQQQDDLVALGRLIVCLACNSMQAVIPNNLSKSAELISTTYSSDVKMLLQYLLTQNKIPKKINDLMPMIGARFYTHIEKLQLQQDVAETELKKELENGRLFRLLCKINAVLDRPEHVLDPSWFETGERYMLKLFRSYLFHKIDEMNLPWIDLPHIIQCLNKLDSGSKERIMLSSPQEQSVIVVEFKEVKVSFDKCYNELFRTGFQ